MDIKKFSDGFEKNDNEIKIAQLEAILKSDQMLIARFQEKYQSSVIEKDPFTLRKSPTTAQINHAKSKIPEMRREIQEEINEIKA
jgi:hypothetical protein